MKDFIWTLFDTSTGNVWGLLANFAICCCVAYRKRNGKPDFLFCLALFGAIRNLERLCAAVKV